MKKALASSLVLSVLVVAPAVAADIPVKAPRVRIAAPAPTWTGCYVGVYGGYQSASVETTYGANTLGVAPGTPASFDLEPNGAALGPTVGCNFQWGGNWVVGIEADADFISKDDEQIETAFPAFRIRTEHSWLATVRARLGYAFDRGLIIPLPTLFYVTGGVAWSNINTANFVPGSAVLFVEQDRTHTGWTVGFGSEYALGGGWSIKSETLYVNLGSRGYFSPTDPVADAIIEIKPTMWISKLGLNYRFGWTDAVVARY